MSTKKFWLTGGLGLVLLFLSPQLLIWLTFPKVTKSVASPTGEYMAEVLAYPEWCFPLNSITLLTNDTVRLEVTVSFKGKERYRAVLATSVDTVSDTEGTEIEWRSETHVRFVWETHDVVEFKWGSNAVIE